MARYRLDYKSQLGAGGWANFGFYNHKWVAEKIARDLAGQFPIWTYRVTDIWSVSDPTIIKGARVGVLVEDPCPHAGEFIAVAAE